jgi:hypothetical protein
MSSNTAIAISTLIESLEIVKSEQILPAIRISDRVTANLTLMSHGTVANVRNRVQLTARSCSLSSNQSFSKRTLQQLVRKEKQPAEEWRCHHGK